MAQMKPLFLKSAVSFLLIFNFLAVKEAFVNQVHYDDISLTQLVDNSQYICVVKKCGVEYTIKEISINWDKRRYPPFREVINHFVVVEELLNNPGVPFVGKKIDVIPSDLDTKLEVHKMYYLKGIAKSPIYASYGTALNFDDAEEMIVFLRSHGKGTFAFVADGAYEDIAKKDEIMGLVNTIKARKKDVIEPVEPR